MRVSQSLWVVLAVGFVCLLMLGTGMTQSDRGTIAGSVLDGTGAGVQGAAPSLPALADSEAGLRALMLSQGADGLFAGDGVAVVKQRHAACGLPSSISN